MGKLRKARRNLNERNVWIAIETNNKKVELARLMVADRVTKDAEFAQDVINAVGDNLPLDIRTSAELTIKTAKSK